MKKSLKIDLKVGESVSIDGGQVIISLLEKSGQRARLHFQAEPGVSIMPPVRKMHTGQEQARRGIG